MFIQKVKILIGIPGSGKSTYATKFVEENPNWVRINRDDYRFMLKNLPVCDYKVEKLITQLSEEAILLALDAGFNVIIDNTNLKESYIDRFKDLVDDLAEIEYKVFDIELSEAIERDKKREKMVGEEVINRMYNDYLTLIKKFEFK